MTAYEAWIANLPADQRQLAQMLMAQLMAMLDDRFNELAGEVQRWGRRHISLSERVAEDERRLDSYEAQQWSMAQEAIAQFAKQQLPPDQRDVLIELLYRLATEVEALKNDDATRC